MAGAADLLARKDSQYGHLRRQGKLERVIGVKWRQKFVVITGGHMYFFKNESAKLPQKIFPLSLYNVVKRVQGTAVSNQPWCFMLVPVDVGKFHLFSCVSEKSRQEWIGKLKYAMTKAHDLPVTRISDYETGDFAFLEEPIVKGEVTPRNKAQTLPNQLRYSALPKDIVKPGHNIDSDSDSDFSDDEYNYHAYYYPDLETLGADSGSSISARFSPLPPTPTVKNEPVYNNTKRATSDVGTRAQIPKPKDKIGSQPIKIEEKISEDDFKLRMSLFQRHDYHNVPKQVVEPPSKQALQLQERDYYCKTNDKEEVARLLDKSKETGTFLVRQSRGSADRVLAVHCGTKFGTKEFKIFQKDGKYYLNINDRAFDSYERLFEYYMGNNLPMKTPIVTLKQPYPREKRGVFVADYEMPQPVYHNSRVNPTKKK